MNGIGRLALAVAVLLAAACGRSGTAPSDAPLPIPPTPSVTTPPPPPLPGSAVTVHLSGIVSDEQGAPLGGAEVVVGYYSDGEGVGLHRPAVLTDGSGRYEFTFTARVSGWSSGIWVARLEARFDGYDLFYRDLVNAGAEHVEHVRLFAVRRIAAGEAATIPVSRDRGECHDFLYGPCGRFRVTVPASGALTIEAIPTVSTATAAVMVAYGSGDEQGGNPVTLSVDGGTEVWVEVGQAGPGPPIAAPIVAAPAVVVRTLFTPR